MAFSVVEDLYGSIELIVFPKTFSAYGGHLNAGNIILVEGKISVKDEEVKLIAEKISLAPENAEEIIKNTPKNTSQGSANKKKGIFLRVESKQSTSLNSVKNLLSIFEGNMPVYAYFKDTEKYEFLGEEYLTSVNTPMVNELKRILGAENVVVRE